MEKPVDLIVEDTKELIYSTLNNSGLPLSVINMIVKEVYSSVELQYSNHINRLRSEYQIQLDYEAQQNQPDQNNEIVPTEVVDNINE